MIGIIKIRDSIDPCGGNAVRHGIMRLAAILIGCHSIAASCGIIEIACRYTVHRHTVPKAESVISIFVNGSVKISIADKPSANVPGIACGSAVFGLGKQIAIGVIRPGSGAIDRVLVHRVRRIAGYLSIYRDLRPVSGSIIGILCNLT